MNAIAPSGIGRPRFFAESRSSSPSIEMIFGVRLPAEPTSSYTIFTASPAISWAIAAFRSLMGIISAPLAFRIAASRAAGWAGFSQIAVFSGATENLPLASPSRMSGRNANLGRIELKPISLAKRIKRLSA